MDVPHTGERPVIITKELDVVLLELTEKDPSGLLLLEELCVRVEANEAWTDEDKELVYEAVELADYAHNGQKRGDDEYFSHPVRVAVRLFAKDSSPEFVAAGLLHDAVEDNPLAVIVYLLGDSKDLPSFIGPSKEEQIEIAITMLYDSERFGKTAPYVDAVTDRPYPPEVEAARDEAKNTHRANELRKLGGERNPGLALKDCDNYDNVIMLCHHEALHGDWSAEAHLIKLLDKYAKALDVLEQLANSGNKEINLEDVNYRQRVLLAIWSKLEEKYPITAENTAA